VNYSRFQQAKIIIPGELSFDDTKEVRPRPRAPPRAAPRHAAPPRPSNLPRAARCVRTAAARCALRSAGRCCALCAARCYQSMRQLSIAARCHQPTLSAGPEK